MKWKSTIFSFVFISFALRGTATTIVVIRSPTQIVIAADSLYIELADTKHQIPIHGCKIFPLDNNFIFASAGLNKASDTRLNVNAVGIRVMNTKQDLSNGAKEIADRIRKPLLASLIHRHRDLSAADYAKLIGNNTNVLSFVIAGVQNGIPTFVGADFAKINDAKGNPIGLSLHFLECPGDTCPLTKRSFTILGISEDVKPFINKPGFWSQKHDLVRDARNVVQTEIAARPDMVGPPIDVLTLDSKGRNWVAPYGKCNQ